MSRIYSELEVQLIANSLIGKTFGEINRYELKNASYDKGAFGHIIESDGYSYKINSFSEPDFIDAGIELKVTPYKINKNKTLSAKERLVLNMINFMDEYKNEFYTSHFWFKNKKLQIIWYLYEKGKKKEDYKITHQILFEFPKEDLEIIISDWNYIIRKIKEGKAHEISEADTMYLGACTKGSSSKSLRTQPFSKIKAKQRAFCLKQSYMTSLVRKYIGNSYDAEKIIKNNKFSFNEFINNIINKYKGMKQSELVKIFNIEDKIKSKDLNYIIVSRMFNVKSNLKKTEEFQKANIIPKTIQVKENGKISQSMSFPCFKFIDVANTEFEDSDLRNELETTKFMFFIFRKKYNEYIFDGIKLWNMPEVIIEKNVKEMYNKTRNIILTGHILKEITPDGKRKTNFPGSSQNEVCHVRPHGTNTKDTYPLPVKDKLTGASCYTKQCFWINNKYLEKIILDK